MMKRVVAVAVAGGLTLAACGGNPPAPLGDDGVAVTVPAPAEGPVPELPVSAEAQAGSPLPEIAVRRVNGEGGWTQFKNQLPADKPLLVWFWAPH